MYGPFFTRGEVIMRIASLLISLIAILPVHAQDKDKKKAEPKKLANVFTDIADAPLDYRIQGEYANDKDSVAFQVVARGSGKFDVYILEGGLPGAGWDPKSAKIKIEAKLDADKGIAAFKNSGHEGVIEAGKKQLYWKSEDLRFSRVERQSPMLGAKPPEGALILFDGKHTDEWKDGKTSGEFLGVPATTKKNYKDFKLHIEFRTPFQPTAGGQGRGNSGVYLLGREVQVLDSFGLKGVNDECGGLYGFRAPDVNMCFPPLVWQTYDIEYRTGKIDADTKKQGSPRITVSHNGVLIHENIELKGGGNQGNIHLQNHGNPVVYRNIWLLELK